MEAGAGVEAREEVHDAPVVFVRAVEVQRSLEGPPSGGGFFSRPFLDAVPFFRYVCNVSFHGLGS